MYGLNSLQGQKAQNYLTLYTQLWEKKEEISAHMLNRGKWLS